MDKNYLIFPLNLPDNRVLERSTEGGGRRYLVVCFCDEKRKSYYISPIEIGETTTMSLIREDTHKKSVFLVVTKGVGRLNLPNH